MPEKNWGNHRTPTAMKENGMLQAPNYDTPSTNLIFFFNFRISIISDFAHEVRLY
jgi:hypothetical protein